jgi:hypothetical protein
MIDQAHASGPPTLLRWIPQVWPSQISRLDEYGWSVMSRKKLGSRERGVRLRQRSSISLKLPTLRDTVHP